MLPRNVMAFGAALVTTIAVSGRAAEASPITIDSVGDAFTVLLTGVSDPGGLPVSVEEEWLVTAFGPTSITFQVSLDNTSATSPSRLTGFGFDTDPDATGGTSDGTLYPHLFVAGHGGGFDVCVENDQNNNCFGNRGNIGLEPEDPVHTFLLTLYFPDTSDGIVMSHFFARLQGISPTGASAKIFGEPNPEESLDLVCADCDTVHVTAVPEPGSTLLIGSAVAAFLLRRKRSLPL